MIRVSLSKHKRKAKTGKTYMYWYLRWFSSDGTQRDHSIGRVDGANKLSKRQAELLRSRKEQELNEHPGRCDVSRAPVLSEFLETYLVSRVHGYRNLDLVHSCCTDRLQSIYWLISKMAFALTKSLSQQHVLSKVLLPTAI